MTGNKAIQGFPIPPFETLKGDLSGDLPGQLPPPTWDDILPWYMKVQPVYRFAIREDLADTGDMFLPMKAEPHATGYDVRAAFPDRNPIVLKPFQYFKIPLGFRAIPAKGWWFNLHPRSSTFAKKHLHNLIGVIDEHYSLEVIFAGQFIPDANDMAPELTIKFGDAIGQIIPVRRQDMCVQKISNDEFNDTCERREDQRRTGGFGSTDK